MTLSLWILLSTVLLIIVIIIIIISIILVTTLITPSDGLQFQLLTHFVWLFKIQDLSGKVEHKYLWNITPKTWILEAILKRIQPLTLWSVDR